MTIKTIQNCALLLLTQSLALTLSAHAQPATQGAVEVAGRTNQFGSIKFLISSTAINGVDTLGYMLWSQNQPNRTLSVNAENKAMLSIQSKTAALA
ncbi:MAG: hypothetical protein IPL73_14420 [Candidatus Obscuribacter sp.]|nr:hypothetical protein [Candidatus Obscuribacter sp.]